jgi:phage tail protein X
VTVAFYLAGSRVQSASATSLTPAVPTPPARSGGALIAIISAKTTANIATATAGWTKVRQSSGAGFTQAIFIAPLGSASPVLSWTGAAPAGAVVVYVEHARGPLVTNAIGNAANATGGSNPHTNPGIISAGANSLALFIDSVATSAGSYTATPAGWDRRSEFFSGTDGIAQVIASRPMPLAIGSGSGAINVTGTGTAATWISEVVELLLAAPVVDTGNPTAADVIEAEITPWAAPAPGIAVGDAEITLWGSPGGAAILESETVIWALEVTQAQVAEAEIVIWARSLTEEEAASAGAITFSGAGSAILVGEAAGAASFALSGSAAGVLILDASSSSALSFSGAGMAEGVEGDTFALAMAAAPAIAVDLTIATPLEAALVAEPTIGLQPQISLYLGSRMRARPRLVATLSGLALPVAQIEDPRFIYAHRNESLDALIWRARGLGSGAVERVLAANPGLAGMGTHLPEGHPVFIPDLGDVRTLNLDLIQLWD